MVADGALREFYNNSLYDRCTLNSVLIYNTSCTLSCTNVANWRARVAFSGDIIDICKGKNFSVTLLRTVYAALLGESGKPDNCLGPRSFYSQYLFYFYF